MSYNCLFEFRKAGDDFARTLFICREDQPIAMTEEEDEEKAEERD